MVSPMEACGEREVAGAAEVVLFEDRGSCLPGDMMVLFRCSPSDDPVLRLSTGRGALWFLGGRFAVPVAALPATVRFAGSSGGVDVLIADPPDPTPEPSPTSDPPATAEPTDRSEPLIYVRRDGVTERWLRLERGRKVHDPPVAWLIGDSILHGGREQVASSLVGWNLTLDAEVGRSSSAGVELAQQAAAEDADVVLVELGTNDPALEEFRSHLIATLAILRDVPLVLWQTVRVPDGSSTSAAVNQAIREVVPDQANAAIADWEAFVPDEAVRVDGIHPDPGFEGLEAELLAPLLTAWHDAIVGAGATGCVRTVVRVAKPSMA